MKLAFIDESGTKDVKFVGRFQKGAKRYFLVGVLLVEPKCYHDLTKCWKDENFINEIIARIHDELVFNVLHGTSKVREIVNEVIDRLKPVLLRKDKELKGNEIAKAIDEILKKHDIPKNMIDVAIELAHAIIIERSFARCNDVKGIVIRVDKSKVKKKGFEETIFKVEAKVKNEEDFMEYIGLLLNELSHTEKYLSELVMEIVFDRLRDKVSAAGPVVIVADKDFFRVKKLKDDVLHMSNVTEVLEVDSRDALGVSLCDIMLSFARNLMLHPSVKDYVKRCCVSILDKMVEIDVTDEVAKRI